MARRYRIEVDAPQGHMVVRVDAALANSFLFKMLGMEKAADEALSARDTVVAGASSVAATGVIKPQRARRKQYEPRICALPECDVQFEPKRVDQKYCSRAHGNRHHARLIAERKQQTTGGPVEVKHGQEHGTFELSLVAGEGVRKGTP
jgi:hypothetical protein